MRIGNRSTICALEEWLVIEWTIAEAAPTKYRLSNLPASTSLKKLVSTIHLRWRIERDYQELKNDIGIDYFEGRSWTGFHHHAALCIAAYGFIAAERARFFPLATSPSADLPQADNAVSLSLFTRANGSTHDSPGQRPGSTRSGPQSPTGTTESQN